MIVLNWFEREIVTHRIKQDEPSSDVMLPIMEMSKSLALLFDVQFSLFERVLLKASIALIFSSVLRKTVHGCFRRMCERWVTELHSFLCLRVFSHDLLVTARFSLDKTMNRAWLLINADVTCKTSPPDSETSSLTPRVNRCDSLIMLIDGWCSRLSFGLSI
jgi:hypothetical protein